jgi:hypothetical protein
MFFESELIVADEEVVVAAGVLSEQPTTVTRAQTASKARTRFFICFHPISRVQANWSMGEKSARFRGEGRKTKRKGPRFAAKTRKAPQSDPQNADFNRSF